MQVRGAPTSASPAPRSMNTARLAGGGSEISAGNCFLAGKAHRVQLHAERRFDRVVPARLDVDRLPQAFRAFQPVLRDPAAQLGVGLELFLLALQRLQRRLQPGAARACAPAAARARSCVRPRASAARFRGGQRRLERLQFRGERLALAREALEHLRLGDHQRHVFLLQAVLARLELREDLQRVRFARLLDALFLLGARELGLGGAHGGGGLLPRGLGFAAPSRAPPRVPPRAWRWRLARRRSRTASARARRSRWRCAPRPRRTRA